MFLDKKHSCYPLPPEFPHFRTGALLASFGLGRDGKNGQGPEAFKLGGKGLDQCLVVREDGGLVVPELRLVREVVA